MRVSDVYKQSLGQWAPDGKHLAAAAQNRLMIREVEAFKLVQVYICIDKIERIEWAPDSEHLVTEVARRGVVQVWSLKDAEWTCRIDEGLAGVAHARWGISSSHLFVYSEFQLYLSIWKLEDQSQAIQLRHPKYSQKGLAFSRNKRWMALLRRSNCKDSVVVHTCDADFARLSEIALTGDMADVAWAPDDSSIVLWDRPAKAARFVWYSPRGELLAQVDECGLLRSAFASPSGQLLAGGCFDGGLHLVSSQKRKALTHWAHDLKVACAETSESDVVVLREEKSVSDGSLQLTRWTGAASVKIPEDRPGQEATALDGDGVPRQGVCSALWSPDERFLATRKDGSSSTLWIWDVGRLALSVVVLFRTPIRSVAWDPSSSARGSLPRLAVSTADQTVFVWSASDASHVQVAPNALSMTRLQWREDGGALLCQERDRACILFPGISTVASFSPPPRTSTASSVAPTSAEAPRTAVAQAPFSPMPQEPVVARQVAAQDPQVNLPHDHSYDQSRRIGEGGGGALAMAALAGEALMGHALQPQQPSVPLAA